MISHAQTMGKGQALRTGLHHLLNAGTADYVPMLDGDLQHRPEEAPQFIAAAEAAHADLVVGEGNSTSRDACLAVLRQSLWQRGPVFLYRCAAARHAVRLSTPADGNAQALAIARKRLRHREKPKCSSR